MRLTIFFLIQIFSDLDYGGWTGRKRSSERLQYENQPETIKVSGTKLTF